MGPVERIQDNFARFLDSDIWHSFRTSPVTVVATVLAVVMIVAAVIAPLITPQDPFDPASLDLLDAFTAPVWTEDGLWRFPLGTDDQGRDLYSAILYGSRISIGVGFASVILSIIIGVTLGLIAGYVGGTTDAVIMRIADVQISFPALLVALLLNGVLRSVLPGSSHETLALVVIIFSIGMSIWPQFARTVRGSTMVEKSKEYVQAARVIGLSSRAIMFRHVLPNVMGPVLVIGTINLAIAVLLEATLSFLGVGVPPTEPSLGTLIRIGQDFLFSGEWWIVIFPGVFLALLVLSVNLLGDWLRDALNPKLR
ncbi:MAG: ABC transporter permease [Minwuia thermotolerans]|nr:MAG: ABC transporter permease [Minwuia thermotolerans]